MELIFNKSTKMWEERKKPYAVVECETKDDYEMFENLIKAKLDGRCVVLPCKVGDIVYTNMSIQGDKYKMADRPYPVKVVFVGMGDGKSYFHVKYDNGRCFPFDFDQIGKIVFLTREAAAAALKGGQDAQTIRLSPTAGGPGAGHH